MIENGPKTPMFKYTLSKSFPQWRFAPYPLAFQLKIKLEIPSPPRLSFYACGDRLLSLSHIQTYIADTVFIESVFDSERSEVQNKPKTLTQE